MGAAAPGIPWGSCAWEGCGEEGAPSPWDIRAGREQLEVHFEVCKPGDEDKVMCWSVRHGAQRDAPGSGAQLERQSSSV